MSKIPVFPFASVPSLAQGDTATTLIDGSWDIWRMSLEYESPSPDAGSPASSPDNWEIPSPLAGVEVVLENRELFEPTNGVYSGVSKDNAPDFSTENTQGHYPWTCVSRPAEAGVRSSSNGSNTIVPRVDAGKGIHPSGYCPPGSVEFSWTDFLDFGQDDVTSSNDSLTDLSQSTLFPFNPFPISPPLMDPQAALPVMPDQLNVFPPFDIFHLGDLHNGLHVPNFMRSIQYPGAEDDVALWADPAQILPASPSPPSDPPSPSPISSASRSPSSGPSRTMKSAIPAEYMKTFRLVSSHTPEVHPLPLHNQTPLDVTMCRCLNKTAKPPRHWRTSCPDNPALETVECSQCGEIFRGRPDNFKRHLFRRHEGKGEGRKIE